MIDATIEQLINFLENEISKKNIEILYLKRKLNEKENIIEYLEESVLTNPKDVLDLDYKQPE